MGGDGGGVYNARGEDGGGRTESTRFGVYTACVGRRWTFGGGVLTTCGGWALTTCGGWVLTTCGGGALTTCGVSACSYRFTDLNKLEEVFQ